MKFKNRHRIFSIDRLTRMVYYDVLDRVDEKVTNKIISKQRNGSMILFLSVGHIDEF